MSATASSLSTRGAQPLFDSHCQPASDSGARFQLGPVRPPRSRHRGRRRTRQHALLLPRRRPGRLRSRFHRPVEPALEPSSSPLSRRSSPSCCTPGWCASPAIPRAIFTVISAIVFVVTLIPDFTYIPTVPGSSNGQTAILVLMHVIAASVIVRLLTGTPARQPR